MAFQPPWDRYSHVDYLFPEKEHTDHLWTVQVGDIVAVHVDDTGPKVIP